MVLRGSIVCVNIVQLVMPFNGWFSTTYLPPATFVFAMAVAAIVVHILEIGDASVPLLFNPSLIPPVNANSAPVWMDGAGGKYTAES